VFAAVPALASMGFSYWLLQPGARERATSPSHTSPTADPGRVSDEWADEVLAQRSTQTRWGRGEASYDELVSAARETSFGLVEAGSRVDPAEVSDLISEGLPMLQSITANLENTTPPVAVPASAHAQLISGPKQLQEDLVDTAASAATTANTRIIECGWLFSSSVDVSDGGGCYRWELCSRPGSGWSESPSASSTHSASTRPHRGRAHCAVRGLRVLRLADSRQRGSCELLGRRGPLR
jgi:hypothetical protein